MYGYKFGVQAEASSLPCARHVQGKYCRCSEMGFTWTIAAGLSRHSQKWYTNLSTNPSNKIFFFQAFSKTSCLICITPSPVDCSHLILLSFCHVSLCRHQQGWGSKRTQAHAYTYTHMHKHFQQQPAEHCPHTLRGADTHGIPQERQNDSMVWADTLVYTLTPRVQPSARHTCTPAFTSPPSTAVWEQFPCTDYDA